MSLIGAVDSSRSVIRPTVSIGNYTDTNNYDKNNYDKNNYDKNNYDKNNYKSNFVNSIALINESSD
jgi:hypothetical protein